MHPSNESNRILFLESEFIPKNVPEEVWHLIIKKASEPKKFEGNTTSKQKYLFEVFVEREKTLRCLSCVSRIFSNYVRCVLPICFAGNYPFSNWLLSHLPLQETDLDLSFNSVIEDKTLVKLTHLRSLKLISSSNLTKDSISQLTNLTELSIHSDTNDDMAEGVSNLTNLTELDIMFCPYVPLHLLSNLTSLSVTVSLDENTILSLPKLTHLCTFNRLLTEREAKIFTHLKSLDLSGVTSLMNSQDIFRFLTQLTKLKIQSESLNDNSLPYFSNLVYLDIQFNSNVTNQSIKNLTQLTHLDISYTSQIDHEGIIGLTNLTFLNVSEIDIPIQNVGIQNLTRLTWLGLSSNQSLTDESIWNLTNLTSLSLLYQKGITDNALKRLTRLIYLDITANSFITDDGLSHLTNLTDLRLASNHHISDRAMFQLTNLRTLEIDCDSHFFEKNRTLTDESVKTLTGLKRLSFFGNPMITDRSVSCLINLTSLDFFDTQISKDCLLRLTQLRISGNNYI